MLCCANIFRSRMYIENPDSKNMVAGLMSEGFADGLRTPAQNSPMSLYYTEGGGRWLIDFLFSAQTLSAPLPFVPRLTLLLRVLLSLPLSRKIASPDGSIILCVIHTHTHADTG